MIEGRGGGGRAGARAVGGHAMLFSLFAERMFVAWRVRGGRPFRGRRALGAAGPGRIDERLQAVVLRSDDALVETLFFTSAPG